MFRFVLICLFLSVMLGTSACKWGNSQRDSRSTLQTSPAEKKFKVEIIVEQSRFAPLWKEDVDPFLRLLYKKLTFASQINVRNLLVTEVTDGGNSAGFSYTSREGFAAPSPESFELTRSLVESDEPSILFVLSDFIIREWRTPFILDQLHEVAKANHVVFVNFFADEVWGRTFFRYGYNEVWLTSAVPFPLGDLWKELHVNGESHTRAYLKDHQYDEDFNIVPGDFTELFPIIELNEKGIDDWLQVFLSEGEKPYVRGIFFDRQGREWIKRGRRAQEKPSPEAIVDRFFDKASAEMWSFAQLLSLVPELSMLNIQKLYNRLLSHDLRLSEVLVRLEESDVLELGADGSLSFTEGVQEGLRKTTLDVDRHLVDRALSKPLVDRKNKAGTKF